MSAGTTLLLAVGLAMDATAVAAGRGLAAGELGGRREALQVAATFGGMQGAFTLAGAWIGEEAGGFIRAFDHWIAFGLLAYLGGKMVRDGLREGGEGEPMRALSLGTLLVLGVATSIDALAAGFTLETMGLAMVPTTLVVGAVTAALVLGGYSLGRHLSALPSSEARGSRVEKRLTLVGGLILLGMGAKVLVDHGVVGWPA
jgi:putative Mn2+ efflux pump MntP